MKLFYTLKAYNFKTKEEAEKHIIQMRKKGWELKPSKDYEVIYVKY